MDETEGRIFGFIAYDANDQILHNRVPSWKLKREKVVIPLLKEIERVVFNTNALVKSMTVSFKVLHGGVRQAFNCTDCMMGSKSTRLGQLQLSGKDTAISRALTDSPEYASCLGTCEFKRGRCQCHVHDR